MITAILCCSAIAIGAILLSAVYPGVLSLCFGDKGAVCPSGRTSSSALDIVIVEGAGVLGAMLAAVWSLRGARATSSPYSLPLLSAGLKLPTGALTAMAGLLLMIGQLVPGFGNLTTPAQVIGWAVVLGYGQTLFTRYIDRQTADVLAMDAARAEEKAEVSLDAQLADVRRTLPTQVKRAVEDSFQETLQGPDLVAYEGHICADVPGVDALQDGTIGPLEPAKTYPVRVRLVGSADESPPGWEGLSSPGASTGTPSFRIVPDSDWLTVTPLELEKPAAAGSELDFSFDMKTPTQPITAGLWITVYQHSRLLQVLTLQLQIKEPTR